MQVITSKLYLQTIHEATKTLDKKEDMDFIHLKMQERVLTDLADVSEDDVMIDGYDHSAFSPYQKLVPPIEEVIQEKIKPCVSCNYTYPSEHMKDIDGELYCSECL